MFPPTTVSSVVSPPGKMARTSTGVVTSLGLSSRPYGSMIVMENSRSYIALFNSADVTQMIDYEKNETVVESLRTCLKSGCQVSVTCEVNRTPDNTFVTTARNVRPTYICCPAKFKGVTASGIDLEVQIGIWEPQVVKVFTTQLPVTYSQMSSSAIWVKIPWELRWATVVEAEEFHLIPAEVTKEGFRAQLLQNIKPISKPPVPQPQQHLHDESDEGAIFNTPHGCQYSVLDGNLDRTVTPLKAADFQGRPVNGNTVGPHPMSTGTRLPPRTYGELWEMMRTQEPPPRFGHYEPHPQRNPAEHSEDIGQYSILHPTNRPRTQGSQCNFPPHVRELFQEPPRPVNRIYYDQGFRNPARKLQFDVSTNDHVPVAEEKLLNVTLSQLMGVPKKS